MFLWSSNFCFIQIRYHHLFSSGMEIFCNCIKHQITVETSGLSARNSWVIQGGPGACSPEKFLKIGPSETPYPAFTGSNAMNSYVYFVELFSESRYSWFPSRSTRIHDSQVFKTKIHDSYMFCYCASWFMIPLPPPIEYLPPKSEKNICTDYTQYCTTLAVYFARQVQLGAHSCQKLFWLIHHSGLTLFVNWALT